MRRRKSGRSLYGLLGVLLVGGLVLLVSSAQAAGSTTYTPDADSYVKSDTPASNFGTATTLRVDGSPTTVSYLRFTVSGTSGAVTNALLRVFANSAQSIGYDVYQVSGTPPTFTESGLIFTNAPALAATKTGSTGPAAAGTWTSVDVTSLVTGDGTYEFGLQTTSSTALSLASRESGANAPQLVVTTGGVSPPTNTGLPVISGILQVGQVLTTTDGTWTGSPIGFAYQWRGCTNATDLGTCSNIVSATAKSYTLTPSELGKFMRVDVTATNGGGPTTATSNATAAVQAAAGNPSPYLVTRGVSDYTAASQVPGGPSFTGSLKFVVESAWGTLEAAGGGTINFAAGDFDLGTDFFLLHGIHNITFAGAGIDVTTIHNFNSTAADTEPFNFGGAFNVTVRDMTVNAGGALRSTSDALDFDQGNDSLVERVKITGSRARGIIFDGKNAGWTADRNIVRDCVITGVPAQGIEFLASTNNLVEGCTITNTAGHGIEMAKSSATTPGIQNNKKSSDNTIRNNTIDQAGGDGISVNSGDRNQITGNTITNSANVTSGRDGIRIFSADSIACDNNGVANNTATDNQTPKTQAYGLRIASALCNSTVVGANNFAGNLTGTILDLGTNTQYTTDTTPPSVPTNVQAAVIGSSEIDVSWTASTDNSGVVAGYHVFDFGVQIANVTTGTSYPHTGLGAGTSHSYTVSAYDAVPNESAQSSPPALATTSGGGGGGLAFVRQNTNSGTGTSLAVSLPATGAGHALVATIAVGAGTSSSVSGVTDSAGGTGWTRGPVGFLSGTNSRVEIWYRLNAPSVTSVTATLTASKALAMNVSEWSGVATASALDVSSGLGFASSTTASTPPLSTNNATDLVIGAINYPSNTAVSTLSSGSFTSLTSFNSSTTVHGRAAYRFTSATGSSQASWSLTALSGANGGAILALKAGSGGGGGGPPAPTLTLTESDATDFVSGSTVFYRPTAASGSFTVTAVSSGATSVQFPVVFGADGPNDTTSPFQQTYSWTSGASATGSKSVTAANGSGTSPPSTFTVTPDSTAPSTTSQCNGSACSGSFSSSSAVTVTLVRSDAGSGVQATYYTTDGSTPTTSSPVYSAPFVVSSTTPVKFFTVDNVGNQESVQTLNVTITGGAGGIAFVQQVVASGTAASLPVTLPATGAGHALVAVIALAAGSSASVSSVTDSASGTWTPGPVGFLTGVNSRVEIWYRLGAPSVTSVTVTLSAAKSAAVNVTEWSGVATASAVDGSLGGSGASSTTASTPSLATTNATDLVIGAINYPAAATSSPPSGSFTSLTDFNSTTSVHGRAAYRITSATGSFQASWPLSIASGGNGGAILALKAA